MQKDRGFTIIELITVIILIGILAVSVLPKFDGTASYEAHTHRAQLISALRLTQQRAMQQTDNDDGYCHQLIFYNDANVSRYGTPNRLDCAVAIFPNGWQPDATGFEVEGKDEIIFSIEGVSNPSAITFNSMGQPINNINSVNGCDLSDCVINIETNVETLKIRIEPEGYIHAI